MVAEWKAQAAQIHSLEQKHQALSARIDADHDYIEYLFHMNEPPQGHYIVMVDDFPILLNPDQISKLAHSYALRELLAEKPSEEARALKQRFDAPTTPPSDTPEFWIMVLQIQDIENREKLKHLFQQVYARDQQNIQELHEVTDQFVAAQQRLQKRLSDATPPPAPAEDHLPKHEREFNQYMRQTQALLDANWRRIMQNQMSGVYKRKPAPAPSRLPAPGKPTAQAQPTANLGDEPVNPTIGRELEEIFQKLDAECAEIFR